MSLLELITNDEREMMAHQVHHYAMSNGDYARGMDTWDANYVLREWAAEKDHYLAKIFKNRLILKKEVEFHKGVDELMEELDDERFPACFNGLIEIFDNLTSYLDPPTWRRDAETMRDLYRDKVPECLLDVPSSAAWEMRRTVYNLCSNFVLATNIYEGSTIEIPIPNGKKLKINRGCRALKTLGKLVEAFGLDMKDFEQYRIFHSQVLNQKKLKGTLCLSIHPLDYITMSDNTSGWESCMSWENSGCYRQGTVEMMNSSCVVVAYLEGEKDMRITGDLYWNNKKWRELYIVHPNIITNVKGYPYCNNNLTIETLKWLRELVHESDVFGQDHYLPNTFHYGYDEDKDELLAERDIVLHFSTAMMYNDFGHPHHICVVSSKVPVGSHDIYINYSGLSECVICGELEPEFIGSSEATNLVCRGCDSVPCCDCCGEPLYDEDYVYINDQQICIGCYEDYYVHDPLNEDTIHKDDSICIHICNAEHDEYATDWELTLTTHRDLEPSRISKSGNLITKTSRTLWGTRTKYYLEAGDWTQEFLEALAYNLYGAEDEKVVYEALSRSDWSSM